MRGLLYLILCAGIGFDFGLGLKLKSSDLLIAAGTVLLAISAIYPAMLEKREKDGAIALNDRAKSTVYKMQLMGIFLGSAVVALAPFIERASGADDAARSQTGREIQLAHLLPAKMQRGHVEQ